VLLLHCNFPCIVGDRRFSAAAALKIFLYCWRQEFYCCCCTVNVPVMLETGVLVLLQHCKFPCIVGDRSFSAAAAL
jgi:hypothetical protein